MSASTIPPSGLTLHGLSNGAEHSKHTSTPAILFKLSEDVLTDVKSAANVPGSLQLVSGVTPKIRLGKRTIDLTISPEAFRHELYSASTESLHDLKFTGLVGHRAEIKVAERKQSLGSDAALAALQNTLAAAKQERQAKSVNISNSVLREPKNRFEANREQKHAHRRGLSGSQHASPSLSAAATPRLGAAPTSAPTSNSAAREKAMKTSLVHLLAMRALSYEEMCAKTRIPKDELERVVGKIVQAIDGKWELTKVAYKELDVWNFAYSTQADRQAAIDNAIRAYDRLRIGKDEEIWQRLLPKEDRGKGMVLSKLNIGGGAAHSTPHYGASPLAHGDAVGDDNTKSSNAPLLGAGTPRIGAGKSSALKQIIGKTSKQRAMEEAKEKKRKEREAAAAAAASDREGKGKPPAAKKKAGSKTTVSNAKVKSAELVQDSSEESEGNANAKANANASANTNTNTNTSAGRVTNSSQAKLKAAPNARKPAANAMAKAKANGKANGKAGAGAGAKPIASTSPPSSDAHETPQQKKAARLKAEKEAAAAAKLKAKEARASHAATAAGKSKAAPPGKSTPNAHAHAHAHAHALAAPSSQHKHQLSPNKPDHKPTAPSPLGAARPRVASDVSDRTAVGVQRARPGAETPKGLGISNVNGLRKRHDTITSSESTQPKSSSERMNGAHTKPDTDKARRSAIHGNSTPKTTLPNGAAPQSEGGVKRKAFDPPSQGQANGHPAKHRKTESGSSHSHKSQDSVGAVSSNDGLERSTSSDSGASVHPDISQNITYSQGVNMAQRFHDVLYPNYAKLYDEQAAMERRGETVPKADRQRLWAMHRRLEVMKREIRAASEREQDE